MCSSDLLNKEREDAPLGTAFDLEAKYAKANMIVFNPTTTLLTVDAKGLTSEHFDVQVDKVQYLDTYRMYTVALKRGDAVGVVHADTAYNPDTSGEWTFVPSANGGTGGGLGD